MSDEQRQDYRTVTPGTEVFFRATPVRPQDRRYLLGVAENVSLGGVFISTKSPFPVGTIVSLHLYNPGDAAHTSPVSARAVVRWRQIWREPRGMGLQFLEFTNLEGWPVEQFLDRTLTAGAIPAGMPSPPQPAA